jgi:2'-5' RNA ligase
MIRAFVAIDLPDDVRAALGEVQARLKREPVGGKVSWTKVSNLHLTLQFLGYVEEPTVPKISAALAGIAARHTMFDLSVGGVGVFPNERLPRVLWVGCNDTAGQLQALAKDVRAAMLAFGFEPEQREFTAHLTLGRIKSPRPDAALTQALDSIKDCRCGTMRVDVVHLLQSQLQPQGSIYTKLSSHKLM